MIFTVNGTTRSRQIANCLINYVTVPYLARRNRLSQKQTLSLLKDYHAVVESGLLLGARVPLGRIGSLFLRRRPAQKARIGINPATHERLTIGAKPEAMVARMSFAASLKERIRGIVVP